jgi:hypothetical protein
MAGPSRISDILDHLAWLREQLGADVNQGNAYAGALLTYNAAAALQWHFFLPGSSVEEIANADDRNKAAKIIDNFVWRARELFGKAKRAIKKTLAGNAGKTLLGELREAVAKVLSRLPRLMQLPKANPRQIRELVRSLDPTAMLRDWLDRRGLTDIAKKAVVKMAGLAGPRTGLCSTLAAATTLSDESLYGTRGENYRRGSAEVVSVMLRYALKDYVATLGKKSAERMEAIVQDIIRDIEALQHL